MMKNITLEESNLIGNLIRINRIKHDEEQFRNGLNAEHENKNFTQNITASNVELILSGKVVLANPDEESAYSCSLHSDAEKPKVKPVRIRYAVDATADSIVDSPFTETYGSFYKENRTENRRDNKIIKMDD